MRLYLIKRKADKAFLRTIEAHYSLHTGQDKTAWSDKPQMMLRTPDGVAGNLRKLCSEPYWQSGKTFAGHESREIGWRNFDARKLELYEVVCMDVDVISMTATPATDFAQVEAIESVPLNRFERAA